MPAELLSHEARQRGPGVLILGLSLGAFAFFGIAISGAIGDTLDAITQGMPEGLTAFVGGDVPGGYVVGEIFTLVAPIALVVYAVLTGASAVAGEEKEGTMSLLSAQPVTRTRLLLAKCGALVLSLLIIGVGFWGPMALAGVIYDSELGAARMGAGVVHLAGLALAFGALALALGAATGRADLAAGVAGGLALTAYLTSTMLPIAGLDRWAELSPWHYALGSDPLRNGVDLAHLGVFAAIALSALGVALVLFNRRDLRG